MRAVLLVDAVIVEAAGSWCGKTRGGRLRAARTEPAQRSVVLGSDALPFDMLTPHASDGLDLTQYALDAGARITFRRKLATSARDGSLSCSFRPPVGGWSSLRVSECHRPAHLTEMKQHESL
ncbi:hypothetical protein AB0E00_24640 [Streptomyces sp. NPDC048110]|uniref:hypothetical protein n=1 Tax=Streptomyces sp. NPDC048110 TaxID=3155483 RepID=UPI0033C40B82